MKTKIIYQVIYTLDIVKGSYRTIKGSKPDIVNRRSIFQVTETDVEETEYYKSHRKYVGYLTGEQLQTFFDEVCFYHVCQTMGALTLRGLEPALSFDTDSNYDGVYENAYVTPILERESELSAAFEGWDSNQIKLFIETTTAPIFDEIMTALENCIDDEDSWETLQEVFSIDTNQRLFSFSD